MGPKAKKPGKKNKITKAERLRMQQEEEERRRKEEEELRVKCEREEMEKLEIQRIEKEKWQKLEEKDLGRRKEELEELALLEMVFPEAAKIKENIRLLSQWNHYLQCDGSPDPSIAQEINTFISLWKEETNETFEEVIQKSKLVLHLIEKLKYVLLDTPQYDLQNENIIQYQGSILELQELLHFKFNIATEILLRHASTLADLDSGNMEKVIQDENITLYLWANLKKNPRYKNIRFSGTEIGFEIPRILAASDIALRILHTHYDHMTPLRLVAASLQEDSCAETQLVKDEVKTVEEVVSRELLEEPSQPEEEANSVHEEETEVEEQEVEVPQSSVQEDPEVKKYELEMNLLSDRISAAHLSLVENVQEKLCEFDDNEVDSCQFATLGGVYHLDIFELPPQCKPMKGWIIVEILKEGLHKYTYPPETAEDLEAENAFPPIEVTLQVHDNVLFFEEPMVARWDAEGKHWKTDGISNVTYKAKERLLTFSLETFGPLTLIQDNHVNMPYQSWELTPLDINKVLLTVTTVFAEIQIQIKENVCMLASLKLNNQETVSILEGKWMTPISFINALKEIGLNIFPSGHSHFYVVINYKVALVEMKAYRQMALLSPSFAFGWSRWNLQCDSTRVVFKMSEHLAKEEPIQNPDSTLLMFSAARAQRLKINEYSEVFSDSIKEETEFHSTLYHMVKDFASQAAMEKIRSSNCQFIDSVCHMLLSTRLLSYS
ncbi:dynein axonemal intermediate chain 7 isoform X3 [Talpa occidentalis]|uniref:dynein axonemal intermediate chain 7 isoform X3 n=1 Tax=Talpa occidentalis TaxID=50954 RepID=UPI0023F8416E|nr:dynein axonemal intermediate chain 7 isoform X3 [Talpa occidentalis]